MRERKGPVGPEGMSRNKCGNAQTQLSMDSELHFLTPQVPQNCLTPLTIPLHSHLFSVIKGWDQGLMGMCVGEKRKLTIPSDLGYGSSGSGAKIPGGATLVFDIELLKINGK